MKTLVSKAPKRVYPLAGLCATVALSVAGAAAVATAGELPAQFEQHRCNGCHATTDALIGPPFLAVASRYGNDRERMVEVLARKILLGGGGSWGAVAMVPNDHVSLEEARSMAQWILALQPPR